MVNGQCLTTMVTTSWWSSGQDMVFGGLGMANSKSGDYSLLSLGKVLELLRWPQCWFHKIEILFASSWGWRHREPFDLTYNEFALVIEWQRHTCSFLLYTKPLWHWGKKREDQRAKEILDQDIDPLASVHHTDLKALVNCYIQQLVQTKLDLAEISTLWN